MTSTLSGCFRCRAVPFGAVPAVFRPRSVPVSPCPLRRRSVCGASTFQRRWPDNLAIIECRSVPRPCGSGPHRPSSSAVAANKVWSPGDRPSLVSSSGRPDRGPGGHSCGREPQAPVWLFTPFQESRSGFDTRSGFRSGLRPSGSQAGFDTRLGFRSSFRLSGPAGLLRPPGGPVGLSSFRGSHKPLDLRARRRLSLPAGPPSFPGNGEECKTSRRSGQMRFILSFRAIEVLFARHFVPRPGARKLDHLPFAARR